LNRLVSVLAIVSGLGLLACSDPDAAEPWRPSDVIFISLDTLRADHLRVYGYDRPISPHIDALAADAALFERAYTQASHTLIAHASVLTGLYPERHGADHQEGALAPGVVTLAEVLAGAGYQTGGFVNALWLTPRFNMERGFQTFDYEGTLDQQKRSAEETNRAIFEWVDRLGDAPYFLFAHYYDVHSDWERLPYDAPAEYLDRIAGPEPPGFEAGDGELWATRHLMRRIARRELFDEDDLRYVERLYDAGIAYTDAQVGRLLEGLRERGRLDRAIIVLTSDHGEEFQEHGRLIHTQVYEETVRVPLLVSMPEMRGSGSHGCRDHPEGFRASRIPQLVQHVDLLPTLTECLGVEGPDGLQGTSLLAALAGGDVSPAAAYFVSPAGFALGRQRGVVRGGWKLVELDEGGPRRLFHLAEDPEEQRDLSGLHPEKVAALARELDRHRGEHGEKRTASEKVELSGEERAALRALGYFTELEGGVARSPGGSDGSR